MTSIFLKGSTLILFAAIVALTFLYAVYTTFTRMGTQRIGFPFRFYESTSAPPPAFGSTFSWKFLLLDLLIYYLVAVCISLLWNLVRSPSNP
jgi:hypothetical protein